MAIGTKKELRNQVMYCVFIRNYSQAGTFRAVQEDLDRIQDLGTDIIWLMPIHPLGEVNRKGALGSPYAIRDYRAVNPEFGTREDFIHLVDAIHARGMKCIIDVVYNHTSPDSVLAAEHPEWFYHKPDGRMGNRVGEWTDVVDLDYANTGLWDYQIETLKQWARVVDGFRCDVAPLVPLEFWRKARAEVEAVRPGCIWLAESVQPHFVTACRENGLDAASDSQLYQAFDLCYDYDVNDDLRDVLTGKSPLSHYARQVTGQEATYPSNYVKLRFLENHDVPRARFWLRDEGRLRNWLAFQYFQKGTPLIYAGQEVGADHLPSLFDKDPVNWNGDLDLGVQMKTLYRLKKHPLMADSSYRVWAAGEDFLCARHRKGSDVLFGAFCVGGKAGAISVDVPDGNYVNLLDETPVTVLHGHLSLTGSPVVLAYTAPDQLYL